MQKFSNKYHNIKFITVVRIYLGKSFKNRNHDHKMDSILRSQCELDLIMPTNEFNQIFSAADILAQR
jgi:hypothetical protein